MYDVRFGTDDAISRCFRLLQLCTFLYIGAVANSWDPGNLFKEVDVFLTSESLDVAVSQDAAVASFKLVAFTFAASRGILAAQYAVTGFLAGKAANSARSLIFSCAGLTSSLVLAGLSATLLPITASKATVKVVLLYLGIAIEVVVEIVGSTKMDTMDYTPSLGEALSERLAALTLVILGEGFISVLRSVDQTVNAFTRSSGSIYIAAISTTIIGFMIWLLYFGCFDKQDFGEASKRRRLLWVVLHLPLHFCILALTAGMANSLRYSGLWTGFDRIPDDFKMLSNDESSQ